MFRSSSVIFSCVYFFLKNFWCSGKSVVYIFASLSGGQCDASASPFFFFPPSLSYFIVILGNRRRRNVDRSGGDSEGIHFFF